MSQQGSAALGGAGAAPDYSAASVSARVVLPPRHLGSALAVPSRAADRTVMQARSWVVGDWELLVLPGKRN